MEDFHIGVAACPTCGDWNALLTTLPHNVPEDPKEFSEAIRGLDDTGRWKLVVERGFQHRVRENHLGCRCTENEALV